MTGKPKSKSVTLDLLVEEPFVQALNLSLRSGPQNQVWRPPTDLFETEDALIVKLEVAGMLEEDFSISFRDGILSVSGVRKDQVLKQGYHQMEISYGKFDARIKIGQPVEKDGIRASYVHGFLTVIIPKRQRQAVVVTDEEC